MIGKSQQTPNMPFNGRRSLHQSLADAYDVAQRHQTAADRARGAQDAVDKGATPIETMERVYDRLHPEEAPPGSWSEAITGGAANDVLQGGTKGDAFLGGGGNNPTDQGDPGRRAYARHLTWEDDPYPASNVSKASRDELHARESNPTAGRGVSYCSVNPAGNDDFFSLGRYQFTKRLLTDLGVMYRPDPKGDPQRFVWLADNKYGVAKWRKLLENPLAQERMLYPRQLGVRASSKSANRSHSEQGPTHQRLSCGQTIC